MVHLKVLLVPTGGHAFALLSIRPMRYGPARNLASATPALHSVTKGRVRMDALAVLQSR